MNTSLLGAVLALLLGLLWWTGRTRRPLLRSTDAGSVAALNRARIASVRQARVPAEGRGETPGHGPVAQASAALVRAPDEEEPAEEVPWPRLPVNGRERRDLLALLGTWLRGDEADRLRAMTVLHGWRHRDALPLLRRGLRDPHPAVMREAARALEAFRGRPAAAWPPTASAPGRSNGAPPGSAVGPGMAGPLDQTAPLPRNVARTR